MPQDPSNPPRSDTASADPSSAQRRRRARYRAWHRGMRELDLLLGPFADARIETLSEGELREFEALLDCVDRDVYSWISGELALPPERDGEMIEGLRRLSAQRASHSR